MRPCTITTCTKSLRSLRKPLTSQLNQRTASLSTSNINIETPHVQVRPGLKLSEHQTTIVASVLDLFAGRPSLPKLSLWRDDATFSDQFTIATGREKFSAQWYGLRKVFSDIERINHMVQDAGNPMLVDLRTKYVVKGIGMEEMVQSVVAVYLDGEGKIERVEDRWDGKLPEGSISEAFRRLGAATVPKIVSVPKNEEEDARRSN